MNVDVGYARRAKEVDAALRRALGGVVSAPRRHDALNNAYHLCDANLRYFFPHLSRESREAIIAEVLFQQNMAVLDQKQYDLVETTQLHDPSGIVSGGRLTGSHIFCTYHTGSYRHLFHFLMRAGAECVLFLAGNTLNKQGQGFLADALEAARVRGWTGTLRTVNAQDRNSLLFGLRALKRGASLVIYIDGNAGVGSNKENGSLVPVRFFGQHIMARSGIAYLSHLARAPVVPVVCRRDASHALSLTFHQPIVPGGGDREQYAARTTQALYTLLEQSIADAPGQWEGWLYVERYLQRSAEVRPAARTGEEGAAELRANTDRFALLLYGDQPVLLDKARHSCLMLDAAAADVFRTAVERPSARAELDLSNARVRKLLDMGALAGTGSG
jgi:KDO2-lipid IV(A) lauroyltransferase